jgi:hypothetical protein
MCLERAFNCLASIDSELQVQRRHFTITRPRTCRNDLQLARACWVAATNSQRVVFFAVRDVWKETRRLFLLRTSLFLFFPHFIHSFCFTHSPPPPSNPSFSLQATVAALGLNRPSGYVITRAANLSEQKSLVYNDIYTYNN